MLTTGLFSTNLEWPAPGARVAGPIVWLRGWVVGHAGNEFVDLRARTGAGIFLGVLGLPRVDLAAHFAPHRRWLPAEFVVAVPCPDGPCRVHLEAQDAHGNWLELPPAEFIVAPDGAVNPRTDGKFLPAPGGGAVERVPHLPLHGHLDDPLEGAPIVDGVLPVFGWFVHDDQPVRTILATFDLRVFSVLASGITDDELARNVPALPAARHGRVRGTVPYFATYPTSSCLRVYAELADGTVHLAWARRFTPGAAALPVAPTPAELPAATLPALPSGRPRRLLFVLRTLQGDEATRRALDIVTWLAQSGRWSARVVAAEDGPFHAHLEAAGCPVQLIDLRALSAAQGAAVAAERDRLERGIWWRHLDAVVIGDETSEWAAPLAARQGLPVFRDPAAALAWHPPAERLTFDPTAPFVAPLRGLDRHGAPVLLAAARDLGPEQPLVIGDLRHEEAEDCFRAALAHAPGMTCAETPVRWAALVCPAWRDHPVHLILAAAISGVPVITTPTPALAAAFAAGELTFIPPGNPLALTHALADLRARPEAARRRAEAARRVAAGHFDPARQLPRWCAALEAAVAARR